MPLFCRALFVNAIVCCAVLPCLGQITVDEVTPNFGAAQAGLEPGDIISAWSRGPARATLDTPFDLFTLEINEGPRGGILLDGQRAGQPRSWTLGFVEWRFTTNWTSNTAALKGAAAIWPLFRAAVRLGQSQDWDKAGLAYEAALQSAAEQPAIAAHILRSWGEALARGSNFEEAAKRFGEAAELDRKVTGESLALAADLHGLSLADIQRGAYAPAEEAGRKALEIREKLAPGSLAMALSINALGTIARRLGKLDQASQFHQRALEIREKVAPGGFDVAASLQNLANVLRDQGESAKSEELHKRVLAIRERLVPDSVEVAANLNNLGLVAWDQSHLTEAEAYLRRSLAIYERKAPNGFGAAQTLSNLAAVLVDNGDLVEAEPAGRKALAIFGRVAPGSDHVAMALNVLGNIAYERGDLDRCEQYHLRSAELLEKVGVEGALQLGIPLYNLGGIAFKRGRLNDADGYFQRALAHYRKLPDSNVGLSEVLYGLGRVAADRGKLPEAEKLLRESIAGFEKDSPATVALSASKAALADVLNGLGRLDEAEVTARQSLELREKLTPDTTIHADSLYSLASILRKKKQPEAAIKLVAQALEVLEKQTARLGGTHEIRSAFRARHTGWYRDYIDFLIEQGQPERAFHFLEQSRARSLLDLLAERDLVFTKDLPPEVERERRRNAVLYDRIQEQIAQLNAEKDTAKLQPLRQQLRELDSERVNLAERTKTASPKFATLQYPQPLNATAAAAALDAGTVFASFSVGQSRSHLFVLDPTQSTKPLTVFTLKIGEKDLRRRIKAFRKQITSRADIQAEARALYRLLLAPAERKLESASRILIAPDGPLHILPFAALMRPDNKYAVEWKPIHTTLSATVYSELRKSRAPHAFAMQLAAFGDPRYPSGELGQQLKSIQRNGFSVGALPFSRAEVEGITALFKNDSQAYLGPEATETRAKGLSTEARYLHFAAHGLLNEQFPLDSGLMLTIPDDPREGEDNGILQAWELFEQVRWNADLVVLSACQSGLGQELGGEGLMGLTRAIQYAGAQSVLASLWSVDDRRTSQLMRVLYAQLRQGKSKDEALRAAQISLLKSPSTARPLYWAAFSLNGDWK